MLSFNTPPRPGALQGHDGVVLVEQGGLQQLSPGLQLLLGSICPPDWWDRRRWAGAESSTGFLEPS